MFRLTDSVQVNAPIERCFLLATHLALVQKTIGLRPVQGKTSGLVVKNDQIVWKGWKFGLPAMHETLITGYERPTFFQDTMGRGRFKFFQHDHHFEFSNGKTIMWDVVRFALPFGFLGRLVARFILIPHIRKLMAARFAQLKRLAESDQWQPYLLAPDSSAATQEPREIGSLHPA